MIAATARAETPTPMPIEAAVERPLDSEVGVEEAAEEEVEEEDRSAAPSCCADPVEEVVVGEGREALVSVVWCDQ